MVCFCFFFSFAINFQLGPSELDPHAFHFNPRIGRYTALNSFSNGRWEKEEKASDKPFTAGGEFTAVFHFTPEGYVVSFALGLCISQV